MSEHEGMGGEGVVCRWHIDQYTLQAGVTSHILAVCVHTDHGACLAFAAGQAACMAVTSAGMRAHLGGGEAPMVLWRQGAALEGIATLLSAAALHDTAPLAAGATSPDRRRFDVDGTTARRGIRSGGGIGNPRVLRGQRGLLELILHHTDLFHALPHAAAR